MPHHLDLKGEIKVMKSNKCNTEWDMWLILLAYRKGVTFIILKTIKVLFKMLYLFLSFLLHNRKV